MNANLNVDRQIITVVNTPVISMTENETAGDVLLQFYRKLGWNGKDILDPCRIFTTKAVYYHLYDMMNELCADPVAVGMAMVNRGPSTEDYIPQGKVYLLDGWVTPERGE